MEVQCKTFDVSLETVPSLELMEAAVDPRKRAELLRAAGFETQAENLPKRQRADNAAQKFKELPEADFQLWAAFLTNATDPSGALLEPPDDVLIRLVAARESRMFDDVIVLSHPETFESLLLGIVDTGTGIRRFQVGQWWIEHMTTVEGLRKQHRLVRTFGRLIKQAVEWHPDLRVGMPQTEKGAGAFYVMLTLLATAACLCILWWTDSWWAFIVPLAIAMYACDAVPKKWKRAHELVSNLTLTIFILGLAFGPVHLYIWNTVDHTKEVLVCSAVPRANTSDWGITTSDGKMTLGAGFYDGKYYSGSSKTAAESLAGHWAKVTYHGHMGVVGHPPYVTNAKTLRVGTCGK